MSSIRIWAHLASSVLSKLVQPQMSCTNAVRKDPKQQDFHTNDTGSNQRSEKNAHIAEQVTSCFHPHHLLSSFRLIHHPWIYLIVTNNSCHSYYSFKSKRVATDELQISSQWFRWIIQINRFTTQFGILWRIVCKSMMRPMKTPKPLGSAEVFEAKEMGKNRVEGFRLKGSVMHHLMKSIEKEWLSNSKRNLCYQKETPITMIIGPSHQHCTHCKKTHVKK